VTVSASCLDLLLPDSAETDFAGTYGLQLEINHFDILVTK